MQAKSVIHVLAIVVASLGISVAQAQGFAGPFKHPGVLVNKGQLDYIKQQYTGNALPWTTAVNNAKASAYGSLTYRATPYSTVSDSDAPSEDAVRNDSEAAYTQALLWYVTGNTTYAENAINIMNAWSTTLTGGFVGTGQQINDATWAGENFPRAAEIIRYTYTGWAAADITRFQNMLTNQFLPSIPNGRPFGFYGGNQNNSMSEARLNIAVFNEDLNLFNSALSLWRTSLPAYIYMTTDGSLPACPANWGTKCTSANLAKYWYNAPLTNGMSDETYRDLGHVRWGIAGLCNAAETAYQQGVDLWAETTLGTLNATRLANGLELNAGYINGPRPSGVTLGSSVGTWEICYNHLVNRLGGYSLPNTSAYLANVRPTGASYFMNWETLTHYNQGMNGFGPDFSEAATPSSQTVSPGASTAYTDTVTAQNGFTGTVNLSVTGLPPGATGSFSSPSVFGSGSSILTVATAGSTPTGTYPLAIIGTSGSLVHSATITLVVH